MKDRESLVRVRVRVRDETDEMLISSKGKGYKARTCGFDLFFHYSHHGAFTLEGCTVVVRMFYDPTTRCNVDVCNLGRIGNNNEHRNDLIQVKRGIVVAEPSLRSVSDQSPGKPDLYIKDFAASRQ